MYTSNLKIKEGFTSYATTPLGGEYKMFIEEKIYFSPGKIKNSEFLHSKFFKILGLFQR